MDFFVSPVGFACASMPIPWGFLSLIRRHSFYLHLRSKCLWCFIMWSSAIWRGHERSAYVVLMQGSRHLCFFRLVLMVKSGHWSRIQASSSQATLKEIPRVWWSWSFWTPLRKARTTYATYTTSSAHGARGRFRNRIARSVPEPECGLHVGVEVPSPEPDCGLRVNVEDSTPAQKPDCGNDDKRKESSLLEPDRGVDVKRKESSLLEPDCGIDVKLEVLLPEPDCRCKGADDVAPALLTLPEPDCELLLHSCCCHGLHHCPGGHSCRRWQLWTCKLLHTCEHAPSYQVGFQLAVQVDLPNLSTPPVSTAAQPSSCGWAECILDGSKDSMLPGCSGLCDQKFLVQILVHGLEILKPLLHQLLHVDRIRDCSQPPGLLTGGGI